LGVDDLENPRPRAALGTVKQTGFSLDVKEHLLDQIVRLGVISQDSAADTLSQSAKTPEKLRKRLTIASTNLRDQSRLIYIF